MKVAVGILLTLLMFLTGVLYAGNDALSQTSAVPTGERIANYLQGVMTSVGEMVNAKNPGDIFSPKEPFYLSFDYDPEHQVIDVYITGKLENPQDIQPVIELTQKLVLRLNPKLQKYYGVTLKSEDLSMDYLNVNNGKVLVKWVNGQFVDKTKNIIILTPTVSPAVSNPQ